MFETMLTIEELNAMDELSAYTLYDTEVKRLPGLARETSPALVRLARNGDELARQQLVLGCLRHVLIKACFYYQERQPEHIDILDLAQEASLAMLEKLDKALSANDPVAYIVTVAYQAIRIYCSYHAPMIQKPESYSLKRMAEVDPYPASVESFDVPISEGSVRLRIEHIEAPALRLDTDESVEAQGQYRFAALYEAIKHHLSPQQRATLIRQFGLFGQPAETLEEIAQSSHLQPSTVKNTGFRARQKLNSLLETHLTEMLLSKPTAKED